MYWRAGKSGVRMTGPINCTTSGICVSGCIAVVELALAPPGEEVRLEANKIAESEIRPRARVICNAEARTELCCFFFIFFFRWSSGSERRFLLGTPQAPQEISLRFFGLFSDGALGSGVAFFYEEDVSVSRRFSRFFTFFIARVRRPTA